MKILLLLALILLFISFKKKEYFVNPDWSDMSDYQCGFQPPLKNITSNIRSGKLAIFFELKNKMDFSKVWNQYFQNVNPNHYSIFVHFSDGKIQVPLNYKHKVVETSTRGKWGDVFPVHEILIEEALKDSNIFGSVYISNNCIPLKDFYTLYDNVRNSSSILNFSNKQGNKNAHWMFLRRDALKVLFDNRHKVQEIIKNANVPGVKASEEIYPSIILHEKNIPLKHGIITFDCWNPEKVGGGINSYEKISPCHFKNINPEVFNRLQKSGSFFARKFEKGTKVGEKIIENVILKYI
jgi:hypothetical protein